MKPVPSQTDSNPKMALPFDRQSNVQDVLVDWPQTVPVFLKHRMLCVGCYVGPFHTIKDACLEHDIDEQMFLHDLAVALAV